MNDEACKILFETLSQILSNQQDILRHLGISKCDRDWGWDDNHISKLINECDSIAEDYNHND